MCLPSSFTFCSLACPVFTSWLQLSPVSRLHHSIRNGGTAGKLPAGSGGGDEKEKCLASSCPMGERNSCRGVPAGSRRNTVESPAAPRTGWVTTQVHFGLSVYKGDRRPLTGWRESSEGKSPCCVPAIRIQFLELTAVGKNRLPKVNL